MADTENVRLGKKRVPPIRAGSGKQYQVKASGWHTPASDLPGAKDKLVQLPGGSAVLLRSRGNDGASDTISLVTLSERVSTVAPLQIADPKAPTKDNMHWGPSEKRPVSVAQGAKYAAIWFPLSQKGPPDGAGRFIPFAALQQALDAPWNQFAPSADDARAGRFVVRRAVRAEFNLKWFDGTPAPDVSVVLDLGGKRQLKVQASKAGILNALIPVPEGQATFRLQNMNGDLWTRPFNVSLD